MITDQNIAKTAKISKGFNKFKKPSIMVTGEPPGTPIDLLENSPTNKTISFLYKKKKKEAKKKGSIDSYIIKYHLGDKIFNRRNLKSNSKHLNLRNLRLSSKVKNRSQTTQSGTGK